MRLPRIVAGAFLLAILFLPFLAAAGPHPPERIISLAPNVTETLYALGMGNRIVAVSRQCDYPALVRTKRRVGDMATPSLEAIVSLAPDLVILTDDGNPRLIWERLRALKIPTHVFHPRRLYDLAPEIRRLGETLGNPRNSYLLARTLEQELNRYSLAKAQRKGRRALFILQGNPLIVAGPGTVIDDILRLLAILNVAAQSPVSYPTYTREDIIRFHPDVIFAGHGTALETIRSWRELDAVRQGHVYKVSDSILRLGPRISQAIGEVAAILDKLP